MNTRNYSRRTLKDTDFVSGITVFEKKKKKKRFDHQQFMWKVKKLTTAIAVTSVLFVLDFWQH